MSAGCILSLNPVIVNAFYYNNRIGADDRNNNVRDTSITPLLPEISSEAEFIIQKDLEINSSYSDETNEKRFWEVEGFARVPCGGTHLKRTGEVGKLRLKRKNIGKGKKELKYI